MTDARRDHQAPTEKGGANRVLSLSIDMLTSAKIEVLAEATINLCTGIRKNRPPPGGRILRQDELERLATAFDRQVLVRSNPTDKTS